MSRTQMIVAVAILALLPIGCKGDSSGIRKAPKDPIAITTRSLPGAVEGQSYTLSLQATGGETPYSWAVTAGALPPGLLLDGATGMIAGTLPAPPPSGQFRFTVTATDGDSPPTSDSRTFILNVAPANFPPCDPAGTSTGFPPLDDPAIRTYLGQYPTGLYDGTNDRPASHDPLAPTVEPLDANGSPSPGGNCVLLSVGMSNTTQEFARFMTLAAGDPEVNTRHLVIIDGASGGQTADLWDSPADANYGRVANILSSAGLTEAQVQVGWVKLANPGPTVSLPDPNADAFRLLGQLGNVVRAMKVRYPNLRQVYLTSRIYAGFATTTLNPEPYAYETGYAVKWLVQAQIDQVDGGGVDIRAGDLDPGSVAPWLSWGPYVWADGFTPRSSDGLYWTCDDLVTDGTHPSNSGRQKVANLLLVFLKTDPVSREWFLENP